MLQPFSSDTYIIAEETLTVYGLNVGPILVDEGEPESVIQCTPLFFWRGENTTPTL